MFFISNFSEPTMHRKDLRAFTLVGPTWNNLVLDPLAELHPDNWLYPLHPRCFSPASKVGWEVTNLNERKNLHTLRPLYIYTLVPHKHPTLFKALSLNLEDFVSSWWLFSFSIWGVWNLPHKFHLYIINCYLNHI